MAKLINKKLKIQFNSCSAYVYKEKFINNCGVGMFIANKW
jgi:hypothetical protein